MKWPILLSGVAIAVILGFGYRLLSTTEKPVALKPAGQPEAVGRLLPISSASASTPVTRNSAPAAKPQTATEDRRRVFDSPDLMATIDDIRRHGTADERDWATYLLSSCAVRFMPVLPPVPDEAGAEQPKPASKRPDKELEAQKKRASDALAERCKGVKGLSSDDRAALKRELSEPAAGYGSALRHLHAIAGRDDGRWSSDEAQLISDSLYSGDPVIAREAFFAMLSAVDWHSPGGKERQAAFMLAAGSIYANAPLSEYERLEGCANMGWCGSRWGADEGYPAPSAAVVQLADKYTAAVKSHMDARGILAIR